MGVGEKDFGLRLSKTPGAGTYEPKSDFKSDKHQYSAVTFGFGREVHLLTFRKWNQGDPSDIPSPSAKYQDPDSMIVKRLGIREHQL